jgi:hypothetical protein
MALQGRDVERAKQQLLSSDWEAHHPYKKWQGAHWRLVSFVELGGHDHPTAVAMLEHVLDWLCEPARLRTVPVIEGRARRCASQEGNAVFVASALGHAESVAPLVTELVKWQWDDGGWNCDRRPSATHSSFHETVWPLRGLLAYHRAVGDPVALHAAQRAAELLLRHRLYRSARTKAVINRAWLDVHWPPYWHYDVLQGLRAIAETGHTSRREANDAVAWLRAREQDGRWHTSGRRYWKPPGSVGSVVEVLDWSELASDVVTAQARAVLATLV